ncbi:Gp19/Gp15/Gp42 family protein [Olsenella sp. oral taxon 807]|jgi:hypothetical protein|uniref:Gp19/Gp15/Gp42 family protein n=1 Tax=Olsenella sp. oral taxon 807 TaxID=712411 RepID=UPI00067B96DE|nr:Gp19/Gp15/Gp42 family protein [Olsenella sp. oral taxon 807]
MDPLATPGDLAHFWVGYDASMEGRARALLSAVSAAIRASCDVATVDPEVLRLVCCQATARMMQAGESGQGVTQESWAASPYSGSVSFANPSGDLFLTAFERRLLGIDEPWAGHVMGRLG